MRKIFMSLLFLVFGAGTPSSAGVSEWTGNNNLVVGNFTGGPFDFVIASYSWTGGPQFVDNVPFDPIYGPFSSYALSFYFNGASTFISACDQWEAHCGRVDQVRTTFTVTEDFPTITGGGSAWGLSGPNVQNAPLHIYITLPDGFYLVDPTVAAVPEPSTWAMLLIGFAGVGYAAYRRRLVPDPA